MNETEEFEFRLRLERESGGAVPSKASAGDIFKGTPAMRMVAGMAAPVVGAFQAGANVGDWINKKIGQDPILGDWIAKQVGEYEASKKRGMQALNSGDTDLVGMGSSALTGGLAVSKLAPATSYLGKVAQGTGIGAVAGATVPSATPGLAETGKQAALGAAFGGGAPALIPPATSVVRGAYRMLAEPLTKGGQTAIKGRAYGAAAGDRAPEIIAALRDPAQVIVPGSMPHAGQAATSVGRAEWAALQKGAAQADPSAYLALADAQKAAQLAQVQTVGGSLSDLAAAEGTRTVNSTANYASAMDAGLDKRMAKAMAPQIKNLMERPAMQAARTDAVRWAADNGIEKVNFGSLEGLDILKKSLDRQIAAAAKQGDALGRSDLRSLMQNKSDLLATIKEVAPLYDKARASFAKDSIPINQMQIGQYLENKLVPALGEDAKFRAGAFAGAVRDAPSTLRRALDNAPRFQELSQVLTRKQLDAVDSVVKDLARNARFEDMATLGAPAGASAGRVVSASIEQAGGGGRIPNPLSRVVTIANAILARVEGKMDQKLAQELAQEMLNPSTVANALSTQVAKQTAAEKSKKLINILRPSVASTGGQVINSRGAE